MHSRALSIVAVSGLLVLLATCDAPVTDPTLSPAGPATEIAHGGELNSDPSFVFLEPLVKKAAIPDPFNPDLVLGIWICPVHKPAATVDDPSTWHCETDETGEPVYLSTFAPAIPVVEVDRYRKEWKLDDPAAPVETNTTYRITVRAGTTPEALFLGHADVAVVDNMGAKNALTGDGIAVNDDRSLVIAFHAGNIGPCTTELDCVVQAVSAADGGTVYTRDGFALAIFPPGWYDAERYGEEVNVSIVEKEYSGSDPCLPESDAYLQGGSCYTYTTFPDVGEFQELVTVGQCMDARIHALEHEFGDVLQIAMWADDYAWVNRLPNVWVPLDCDAYAVHDAGWMRRLAHGAFSWLVPPLQASHMGLGGLTGTFSDAGWTLWFDLVTVAGDGQTAPPGSTLPTPVEARLDAVHTALLADGVTLATVRDPVAETPLTFQAFDPHDDAYDVQIVETGVNGEPASYAWALTGIVGIHRVVVSDTLGHSVTVTAEATGPTATIVNGTVTSARTGAPIAGAIVEVVEDGLAAVTDAVGWYSISGVTSGIRTIRLEGAPGQERVVGIVDGTTTTIDFPAGLFFTAIDLPVDMFLETSVSMSASVGNSTGGDLSPVTVRGWVTQNLSDWNEAASFQVDCGAGTGILTAGDCTVYGSFTPSSAAGPATLYPGPATAIIELLIGPVIADMKVIPVVLYEPIV